MTSEWKRLCLVSAFAVVEMAFFGNSAKAATPIITQGNISVFGATGNDGVFISHNAQTGNSDIVRVEWNNSTSGDNNPGVTGVMADFSQFEGDADVQVFDDGGAGNDDYDSCDISANDGIWTACYSIQSGTIDGTGGKNVSVTATNVDGSTTLEDDANATVDNVAPADDSTVDSYGFDAANYSFSGKTSPDRKVYYDIWGYDANGEDYILYASDYAGKPANESGDFAFSGIDISSNANGKLNLYVWVEDPAGNYSPSWGYNLQLIKTDNLISTDKSGLTSAINDEYSDESGRTIYNLTQSGYTPESWAAYGNAITSAVAVEGNGSATLSEVADAISAIQFARDALIRVEAPIAVTGITVNSDEDTMANGATLGMWTDIYPVDATDSDVDWSVKTLSGGTATIDADGLLTATGVGTVTVTATARDGSSVTGTKAITITGATVDASHVATLTSGTYTVSAVGGGSETITNVPFGTSKAAFLAALIKGQINQDWNSAAIADPVATGNSLVVTAQDGATVVTYTITINANMTAYNAALAAVHEADYTTATWATYQGIVDANKMTDHNTQAEIDTATENIIAAQGDLLGRNQTIPDGDGNAILSGDITEVVITDPNHAVDITIANGTNNPTIDVSDFFTDGVGTLPEIAISSDAANVVIPSNTTVTSADSNWDGVIAAPTAANITLPDISGSTRTVSEAIEVGFAGAKLSFDKAVRILLPNQAGKRVGYSRNGGEFTEITNICSADNQTAGDALAADGDCNKDVGSDLVIWTKHFTTFVAYEEKEIVATPTTSLAAGAYISNQLVSLSTATSGATIYYTTDGSNPTASSAVYTSPLSITGTITLKAIAIKSGMTDSGVMSKTYAISIPQVATPTASPAGGSFTSAQSVALSSATSGATIYYTTDGSAPNSSSAAYSSAISITGATTLKAVAMKSGMNDSAVMTEAYNVQVTTNTPTLTFNSSKKAKRSITFTFKDLSLTNKKYVKVRLNGRKVTTMRVSRSGNDSLVTITLKYGRWPVGNYTLTMSYKNQIKVAYLKKGKTKYRMSWKSGSVTSENILSII